MKISKDDKLYFRAANNFTEQTQLSIKEDTIQIEKIELRMANDKDLVKVLKESKRIANARIDDNEKGKSNYFDETYGKGNWEKAII